MEVDVSSPPVSRRSSASNMPTLIVRLKIPPRALSMAINANSSDPLALHALQDTKVLSSPFPPSSPPTVASSPVPSAVHPLKKARGHGKRGKQGLSSTGSFNALPVNGETNPGSGAGTPAPVVEREKAKPGPKTNPGNVNAGLRALDRSGKPTRKWQKISYSVNTCSGYVFLMNAWRSPGMDPFVQVDLRLML